MLSFFLKFAAIFCSIAIGVAREVILGVPEGTLVCDGSDVNGQISLVNSSSKYVFVTAGVDSTCGITISGEGICAGEDDDALSFRTNATLLAMEWEFFALGVSHACGINGQSEAICWGPNPFIERGQRFPPSGYSWVDLAAAAEHSCGITSSGELQCWGRSDFYFGSPGNGVPPWKSVSAGKEHSCAIDSNDEVFCFGFHTFPSLTDGRTFEDACCGSDFLCGVFHTANGTSLDCAGSSIVDWKLFPPSRNDWIGVTCTDNAACGFTDRGHIYCFGLRQEDNIITRTDRVYSQVTLGEEHVCYLPAETVRPEVSLRSPVAPGPTFAYPIKVFADVSEPIETFYPDRFAITLGVADNFVNEGGFISFDVYPDMDGYVKITVEDNAAYDSSLNGNIASEELVVLSDRVPPSINLTCEHLPGPTNWVSFPFRIAASEELYNYTVTDIVVGGVGGTPYNLTFLDYFIYGYTVGGLPVGSFEMEFWVEPFEDGVINVTVPYGWATDLSNNPSVESNTITIERDTIRPNVTVTSPARRPTNIVPIPFLANFTETMFDVDFERFIVEGVGGDTELVEVNGTGMLYYFNVYPYEDGVINVTVLDNTGTDDALNFNYESNMVPIELDTFHPNVTLVIPLPDPTNVVPLPAYATFSEEMQFMNFSKFDIRGIGGFHTNMTTEDNFTFSFLIHPYEDGVLNVSVLPGAGTDDAWNPSLESNTIIIESDTTPPTVEVSCAQLPATNQTVEFLVSFNEEMFGIEGSDFIFGGVGGELVSLQDVSAAYNQPLPNMVFLVSVLPDDQGQIDLNVSVIGTDEATNPNIPAEYFEGPIFDTISPVASIFYEHMPGPVGLTFLPLNLTLTYSEIVYGLNATASFSVSGVVELWRRATVEYDHVAGTTTVFIALMPSLEGGVITIAPRAGVVTDLAGNGNLVANSLVFEIDASRPVITLELLTRPPRPEASWLNWPVLYYASVSEALVEEFHAGMVRTSLPFAEVRNFTVLEPFNYTFEVWNDGGGTLEVWVEEGALWDLYGNWNYETREEEVEVVEFYFKPLIPYTDTTEFHLIMAAAALVVFACVTTIVVCIHRWRKRRAAARAAARKAAEEAYHREENKQVTTFAERRRVRKQMMKREESIKIAPVQPDLKEAAFPSYRI